MSKWFGKKCGYQCCQWEETEMTGGPDFQESFPCLIFCNHKDNTNECEGNCSEKQCPMSAGEREENELRVKGMGYE